MFWFRRSRLLERRFWTATPSHRNAVELFEGKWVSDLAEVMSDLPHAGTPMFAFDRRPRQAAAVFGKNERLDGQSVLELGPLEGAHSYQLEQLGAAHVTAIESNADAFLRCLVIKNALALDKTTFLLGDCAAFLDQSTATYDLIFASGILYHMEDPVDLIRLLAARTRHVFVWSMYYDPTFRDKAGKPLPHRPKAYNKAGLSLTLHEWTYGNRLSSTFYGGNAAKSHWLALDDIIAAFRHHGFTDVTLIEDQPTGERGPAATLAFTRK